MVLLWRGGSQTLGMLQNDSGASQAAIFQGLDSCWLIFIVPILVYTICLSHFFRKPLAYE